MSEDVLLVLHKIIATGAKDGLTFHPSDTASYDVLAAMTNGEVVRCEISRPRNARHHRLAFALMRETFKNQDTYSTFENMYDMLKYATGHFDMFVLPGGEKIIRLRSLAWHMMDQTEFEQWWEKFLNVILTRIIPAANRPEFEKRVYEILGERGPGEV